MDHATATSYQVLRAKIDDLRQALDDLGGRDYPAESPTRFLRFVAAVLDETEQALRIWEEDADHAAFGHLITGVHSFIETIASLLRYVEDAETTSSPWSVVRPFCAFFSRVLKSKYSFIISSSWEFNFGALRSIRDTILTSIDEIGGDKEAVIAEIGDAADFPILTVPHLERTNGLLHVCLGHELGHLVVAESLRTFIADTLTEASPLIAKCVRDETMRWRDQAGDNLYVARLLDNDEMRRFENAVESMKRGLEEIACDIVSALLLGPAAVFASYCIALRRDPDALPTAAKRHYPPWRLRTRIQFDTILGDCSAADLRGHLIQTFGATIDSRDICDTLTAIEKWLANGLVVGFPDDQRELQRVYELLVAKTASLRQRLQEILGANAYSIWDDRHLAHAVDRLSQSITPNQVGWSPDSAPAQVPTILNAGWLLRIGQMQKREGDVLGAKKRLEQLVLKGIELAHEQERYLARSTKATLWRP